MCDITLDSICKSAFQQFIKSLTFIESFAKQIASEKDTTEKLWNLSSRYQILANGAGSPHLLYPEDITNEVTAEIKVQINMCLNNLHGTLTEWQHEIATIEDNLKIFEKSAYNLDWNHDSELISGSEKSKPLDFYLERGRDILFNVKLLFFGINRYFKAMNVRRPESMLDYKKSLGLPKSLLDNVLELVSYSKFAIK